MTKKKNTKKTTTKNSFSSAQQQLSQNLSRSLHNAQNYASKALNQARNATAFSANQKELRKKLSSSLQSAQNYASQALKQAGKSKVLTVNQKDLGKQLTQTLHTAQIYANRAMNQTAQTATATKQWVKNVDSKSIKGYLAAAGAVVRNGGRRGIDCFKNSFRLARAKKFSQSNNEFLCAVTCCGIALQTCLVTCCEMLVVNRLLRRAGYVKSTPHGLLNNLNNRIESAGRRNANAAFARFGNAIRQTFAGAANSSERGYSFLSEGLRNTGGKARRSA